jgi:hypothetical protein
MADEVAQDAAGHSSGGGGHAGGGTVRVIDDTDSADRGDNAGLDSLTDAGGGGIVVIAAHSGGATERD